MRASSPASVKERLSATNLSPDELEYLVAVLQVIPELERSADLAEHIAQRTIGHVGGTDHAAESRPDPVDERHRGATCGRWPAPRTDSGHVTPASG